MIDHTFTMRRKGGREKFNMLSIHGREAATRAARLTGRTRLMHEAYEAARAGLNAELRGRV